MLLTQEQLIKLVRKWINIQVIWVLTISPSLTLLQVLLSFLKLDNMLFGGFIFFPPSINLISLESKSRSLILGCFVPFPRLISPSENPAANEYPSLSSDLSLVG